MTHKTKKPGFAPGWLAALVAIGIIWPAAARSAPQIITLRNGHQYLFAGVTWGTNHVQPRFTAQFVNALPTALGDYLRKEMEPRVGSLASQHTPEPSLCVWLVPLETNGPAPGAPPNPKAASLPQIGGLPAELADENGALGGRTSAQPMPTAGGVPWAAAVFQLVPRRSATLNCIFFDIRRAAAQNLELARVTFPNPLYGQFPQWQPEPLPTVKHAGDAEISFTNFEQDTGILGATGTSAVVSYFDAVLAASSGGGPQWAIHHADLSDATGNHLDASRPGVVVRGPRAADNRRAIGGTLWPDESAWRLTLDLKRTSGFEAAELVTFTNVPVPAPHIRPATSLGPAGTPAAAPLMTNSVGGVRVVLNYFTGNEMDALSSQRAYHASVRVELPDLPTGKAIDFVSAVTDTGERLENSNTSGDDHFYEVYFKPLSADVTKVSFTFAVQKTRSVDFLFKPPPALQRVKPNQ